MWDLDEGENPLQCYCATKTCRGYIHKVAKKQSREKLSIQKSPQILPESAGKNSTISSSIKKKRKIYSGGYREISFNSSLCIDNSTKVLQEFANSATLASYSVMNSNFDESNWTTSSNTGQLMH